MRPSSIRVILDREFASTASQAHTPVMLWGPPGVGKSQIIAQIARHHGVPLIDIRLSQMEPTDLRGVPFRKGDLVVRETICERRGHDVRDAPVAIAVAGGEDHPACGQA